MTTPSLALEPRFFTPPAAPKNRKTSGRLAVTAGGHTYRESTLQDMVPAPEEAWSIGSPAITIASHIKTAVQNKDNPVYVFRVLELYLDSHWFATLDHPSERAYFLGKWFAAALNANLFKKIESRSPTIGTEIETYLKTLQHLNSTADSSFFIRVMALMVTWAIFLQEDGDEKQAVAICTQAYEMARKFNHKTSCCLAISTLAYVFLRANKPENVQQTLLLLEKNWETTLEKTPGLIEDIQTTVLEADILAGKIPTEEALLERLSSIGKPFRQDPCPKNGQSLDTWCRRQYAIGLWWARKGGISIKTAATETHLNNSQEKGTTRIDRHKALQKAHDHLSTTLNEMGLEQNKPPFMEVLGLLAEVAMYIMDTNEVVTNKTQETAKECAVRAWCIFRANFPESSTASWKPKEGPMGRAMLRAVYAAFPEIANTPKKLETIMEVASRDLAIAEAKKTLEKVVFRSDENPPAFVTEFVRRHALSSILLIPDKSDSLLEIQGWGETPGATEFAPLSSVHKKDQSDRLVVSGNEVRRITNTSPTCFHTDRLNKIQKQCLPGRWSPIPGELGPQRSGVQSAPSMTIMGTVVSLPSGESCCVVADRGSRWISPIPQEALEELAILATDYLIKKREAAIHRQHEVEIKDVESAAAFYHQIITDRQISISEILFGEKSSELEQIITLQLEGDESGKNTESIEDIRELYQLRVKSVVPPVSSKKSAFQKESFQELQTALADLCTTTLNLPSRRDAQGLSSRKITVQVQENTSPSNKVLWNPEVEKVFGLIITHLARFTFDENKITIQHLETLNGRTRWKIGCPSNTPLLPEHLTGNTLRGGFGNFEFASGRYDVTFERDNAGTHLPLARLLLEKNGGNISVPDQEKNQSAFILELPIAPHDRR